MRVGAILNTVSVLEGFHFRNSHVPFLRKDKVLYRQAHALVLAGAEQIELTADLLDVENYGEEFIRQEIGYLLDLKKQGVRFSLHAPCMAGIMTGSTHELLRRASVEQFLWAYRLVEPLGIETVTMHPDALVEIEENLKPPSKHSRNFLLERARIQESKSLAELTKVIPSRSLCMENFHYGDIEDYRKPIEKFDISVCFDVGHQYMRSPGLASCNKFLRAWISRIRNVHFYNIRASQATASLSYGMVKFLDHQPLSDPEGVIDVEGTLRLLKHYGYDGTIVLEEYHNPDIASSVRYLRRMLDKVC